MTDRMTVPEAREALEKAGYSTVCEERDEDICVYAHASVRFLRIIDNTVSRSEVIALVERIKK